MLTLAMAGYIPENPKVIVGIDLALFSGGVAVVERTSSRIGGYAHYVLFSWPKIRKQIPKKYKFKQHFPLVVQAHDQLVIHPLRSFLKKNAISSQALIILDWTPMEAMMRGRPTYTSQKAFLAGYYASALYELSFPVAWVGGADVRSAMGLKKATKEEVWEHFAKNHVNLQAKTYEQIEEIWTEHEKDALIMARLAMEAFDA